MLKYNTFLADHWDNGAEQAQKDYRKRFIEGTAEQRQLVMRAMILNAQYLPAIWAGDNKQMKKIEKQRSLLMRKVTSTYRKARRSM